MCMQVFGIDFDLSLVLKIGIKNIFYKVACFVHNRKRDCMNKSGRDMSIFHFAPAEMIYCEAFFPFSLPKTSMLHSPFLNA